MERAQLESLYYITPIENLPSILAHGIVSNHRAAQFAHQSIAMQVIQDRREDKSVPGGLPLHDYVNLYFNPRNKMMSRVRGQHCSLCVLRVSPAVLDLPGVVISDQNASSRYALFLSSPQGLKKLDYDEVFANDWRHPGDQIREWKHGSIVCAEVLVPRRVDASYLLGAIVSCAETEAVLVEQQCGLSCSVNSELFFA
jgi:ssDNA thymidine ADP-ribosyltransferase, DarT